MTKEFWESDEDNPWENSGGWNDGSESGWDEEDVVDVEYEVDDEVTKEKAENVNSKKRKLCKKGLFYTTALFFLGIGNAIFKAGLKNGNKD